MSHARAHHDGRTDRRLTAMRRVQTVALALFAERGLAAVTIEQIAIEAAVGPASIYRNFGTKEGIVLWDDYDPALLASVSERLQTQEPLVAVRDALAAALGRVYARDRKRILQRTRLILAEPSLAAANAAQQQSFRAQLSAAFRPQRSQLEADVLSGIALGLLDAAVREWARRAGKAKLASVIARAWRVAGDAASS